MDDQIQNEKIGILMNVYDQKRKGFISQQDFV